MKHIKYLLCLLVPWLTACSSLPTPPVKVPFAPHTKGAKVEVLFEVKEEHSYSIFIFYPVRRISVELEDKVREIIKLPLRVRRTLIALDKNNKEQATLTDDEWSAEWGGGSGGSLKRYLGYFVLDKGRYKLLVESLDGEQSLEGILKDPIRLSIVHIRGK